MTPSIFLSSKEREIRAKGEFIHDLAEVSFRRDGVIPRNIGFDALEVFIGRIRKNYLIGYRSVFFASSKDIVLPAFTSAMPSLIFCIKSMVW